jgi:GcrA cell cycle regulator
MSWTDDRVALLKKLWGEGRTAAEIAKELGGITRNAVIGKAHRLKLSNRVSPIQQTVAKPAPARKVEDIRPEPAPRRVAANNDLPPIKVKGVKMEELREKMCRWPIGDPKDPKFHFCGCVSAAGMPYCADHARMAYQAATRARTLNADDFVEKPNLADDDSKEAVA